MEQDLLLELTILFGVSVLVSYLFRAIRLSTIVGFLVAGALIGPSGLGLIESNEEVRRMEEIAVILLLFSIGVEFSIDRLRQNSWIVFAAGPARLWRRVSSPAPSPPGSAGQHESASLSEC